jgi:biotin operon repressor
MSVQAITWAYRQRPESALDKFLLVTLANYANELGVCWPSQATLAADMGVGERAVRAHMAALESAGYIAREKRRKGGRQTSDSIRLDLEDRRHEIPAGAENRRHEIPAGPDTGGTDRPSRRHEEPPDPDPGNPGQSLDGQEESAKSQAARDAAEPEPSGTKRARAHARGQKGENQPARQSEGADLVCARWRSSRPTLVARLGEGAVRGWLDELIVAEDSGSDGLLVLEAASPFRCAWIRSNHLDVIRDVMACEVRLKPTLRAVGKAYGRRKTG